MSRSPATIVFDLDGTLVHSAPGLCHALNHVLEKLGRKPLAVSAVEKMIGHGMPKLFERGLAARDVWLELSAFEALYAEFEARYTDNALADTELFRHVAPTLTALRTAGHKLAVCTNKQESIAVSMLDELGIGGHFAAIVGGRTGRAKKPLPDPLLLAICNAGGRAGNAVMVGDSDADIIAAGAAGMRSIAVTFGYSTKPPVALGADWLIDCFSELPEALDAIGLDLPVLHGNIGANRPDSPPERPADRLPGKTGTAF